MRRKILHLTLKKRWFDLISTGHKNIEYREIKHYWRKRLQYIIKRTYPEYYQYMNKEFDEVHFKNGYGKNSPFMRIEWRGMEYGWYKNKKCFAIKLGKILELRNIQTSKR